MSAVAESSPAPAGTLVPSPMVDGTAVERRVLLLAPTGNDATLTVRFLSSAGIRIEASKSMEEVCAEMQRGCGAVVIGEEALGPRSLSMLIDALRDQPSWSDLPIIAITGAGEFSQRRLRGFVSSGSVTNIALLERPFHPETLLSAVEVALRARQRQYQVRELLKNLKSSEAQLQNTLNSISDAFASVDREWRFTYVNGSYMKLVAPLYASPDQLLGQNLWEKFPEISATALAHFYVSAMAEQKPGVVEFFYAPIRAWIEIHVHPSPEILSIYIQDITQRRAAEEERRARSERAQLLSETLAQLLAAVDSDTLVRELFPKVASHLGVDAYFNYMINDAGDALLLKSCQGIPPETARQWQRLEFGQAICGTVAELRRPIVANDIQHSGYGKANLVRGFGIQAYACNPLMVGDRLLGTLSFASRTRTSFTEDELEFIRTISQYTAMALDRLQTSRDLLKNAQRLSLAIAAANLGDWNWDAASDVIELSKRAAEIYGVAPEERYTRENLRSLLHEDYRDLARQESAMAAATGSDYDIEYKINHSSGGQRWISAKGKAAYDEDGRLTGMLGVVQDVTEPKRSVAMIEGQRRVLQLMAEDAALDLVLTALMETVEASSANTLFASLMIADEEEQRLHYASAPSLPPAFTAALDGLPIKAGAASCGTAVALKRSIYVSNVGADSLWTDYREVALANGLGACWSTPIFSKEGRVLGSFAMVYPQARQVNDQDIRMVEMATRTAAIAIERERQQKALRESEARYRALMEQASDGIFVSEREGRHTMVNAAGCRMLGYPLEELLKLRIQDHYLDGEYAADEARLRDLQPGKSLRIERKMKRMDGSTFDVEASVSLLPSGLVHRSLRDVTERRNAEVALLEAKESAEAASRSKDRFLAVLSHELRTPLTPVLMSVVALDADPDLSHDLKQDIRMIRRNVELETKLIDDLLDLSRITSAKLRLRLESVNLNDAIRQVCGICRSQILEKGIRLQCNLGSEEDRVTADPARFQQVLWNVLKNAAKFTPEGGSIHVTTARVASGRFRVQVRDNGLGISEDILPRVFDAFEQGDPKITRQFGGLGLGLAISKAIVELHHGSISVASDGVGKGCVFSIEMPIATAVEISKSPEAPVDGSGVANQHRLLVVEDHVDTARTLGRMLSRMGYSVKTAGNVAGALSLASSERFDLIISDLGLPDATGYEFMKKVRGFSATKGIAMSGFGMDEDIRKSREAGFEEHLVKPVDIGRLQQAIRRILEPR